MAITIPYSFTDGQTIVAAQHNANFNAIAAFVDSLQAGTNFNTGAIGTTDIADDAVTGPKIAGNSVTFAKLATAIQEALVPTGSIIAYAGNTAPSGWLLCDGTAFSSTTYPALYAVLGNSTTLPDLRERVPMGASGSVAVRTSGGTRKIGLNDLPAHSHPNTVASVTVTGTVGVTLGGGDHSHTASSDTTGSSHNHPLPDVRKGAASSPHDGNTTLAAGFSGTTQNPNSDTGFVGSTHTHGITVNSANAGVTVTGTSWTQTGGSATLNNVNNVTTHTDYYQPYYSVNYIIKAA